MKFDSHNVQYRTNTAIVHQKIKPFVSNSEIIKIKKRIAEILSFNAVQQLVLFQISNVGHYFIFLCIFKNSKLLKIGKFSWKDICQIFQEVVLKLSIKFHGCFLCIVCLCGSFHSNTEINHPIFI